MDNKTILLDFKLLVDRAVELLENLSSNDRIEAINYALTCIKSKFSESCEQIKREYRGKEIAENQNELYENLWNQQRSTTTVADLNQNFEKIMCKEEFMCIDDDKYQSINIFKSENDVDSCDPSLIITRYNEDWITPETPSSSTSVLQLKRSDGILSEKLIISGPIRLKCDESNFTFYPDKFCIPFLRADENFNRKAFKRQFLSMIEYAVNHRKPFLRNIFTNLVLSGAIQGVRQKQTETRISEIEYITPINGMNKINSNIIDDTCPIEETSQNTDSSDDVNLITTSPSSSIVTETPKDTNDGKGNSKQATKEKQSYDCFLCPKTYRKRKSLIDHYKMHPGFCHDCGKANGHTLEEIIEHNKIQHAKDFPFVCEICGESYSRRQQFHAHVEAHKKKDLKSYSCGECGMEFSRKKLHRQHLDESGHKTDGAICEVCGAGFTSKNALSQHVVRVHKKDNSFECHICQNRFSLKANLERHVQLHTEIKRTYVCDQCGSSYFTYSGLREHFSNAHTDVSESKCTLCGKTFSSVKSLQRHLPSHSEESPHSCCLCTQTFKWKTHLVRHKQIVHGNQPNPKKLKRFAKCEEELVPVDIPPPPSAKVSRKSNAKPKQTGAKANQSPTSTTQKQKPQNATQLESQNKFNFSAESLLAQCNQRNTNSDNNSLIINMNSFNRGAEPPFHFDPNATYNNTQRISIQTEQQIINTYQQESQQHHHQPQQQQQHIQPPQQQHHHQQPPQQQQQQQIHQSAQPQAHLPPSQQHHQPQQTHHQPQHHQPHHQPQQQSHQQPQQSHHQTPPLQPPQQPQPQQQPPPQQQQHQQYPCASIPNDWHNISFTTPTTAISQGLDPKDNNKYFSVIEVNTNDFMGLPMDVKQENVINAELLNFQNMWSPNSQQLQFNNGNVEQHSYNNIGSILTNLELIGNNSTIDFNNFEMISDQHGISTQQIQHNPYIHQEIDPNSGNINHTVINYDYNNQNHTITDLSNTILRDQDQKNQNFQYHQPSGSYEHPGGVYNQNEEVKQILPPMSEYMHQPMQQSPDVNIVYYPVKNEM